MRSSDPVSLISARTTRFIESTIEQDTEGVAARLARAHIWIDVQPQAIDSFAGQLITFTVLNLLVRLNDYCPQLSVSLPDTERHPLLRLLDPGSLAASLLSFFAPFPAAHRLSLTKPTPPSRTRVVADIHLSVGPEPVPGALTVWSKGWVTYLNERPSPGTGDDNPVGASVAAGLATAEMFKHLISGMHLRSGLVIRPVDHLIFSAFDYGLTEGANPPLPREINVDGAVVVGLGGIGAGLVAAASSLPNLHGRLILVDHDVLDETNLNRHLIARPGDSGPKVELCRRALSFHQDVVPQFKLYSQFIEARGSTPELVIVGVDKDRVRREIQATLPRLILNGGTSESASFRITRHTYLQGACLTCISQDDIDDHPEERELARQLGLDLETVLEYKHSGMPLPAAVLEGPKKLRTDDVRKLSGLPIDEIRVRVCTEVQLDSGPDGEAVSISFLSALPGFLLLGELVKERLYPEQMRPPLNYESNYAFMSLFGKPHAALLNDQRAKQPGCDCMRPAYQRAYTRMWGKRG